MICRLPSDNNDGKLCGWRAETLKGHVHPSGVAFVAEGIGDYVRHLIKAHWPLLVMVREEHESGEFPLRD